MRGKPRILSLFPTRLINSIRHEHSCKILYVSYIRDNAGAHKYELVQDFLETETIVQLTDPP